MYPEARPFFPLYIHGILIFKKIIRPSFVHPDRCDSSALTGIHILKKLYLLYPVADTRHLYISLFARQLQAGVVRDILAVRLPGNVPLRAVNVNALRYDHLVLVRKAPQPSARSPAQIYIITVLTFVQVQYIPPFDPPFGPEFGGDIVQGFGKLHGRKSQMLIFRLLGVRLRQHPVAAHIPPQGVHDDTPYRL